MSKKRNKYIAAFDYVDQTLHGLLEARGVVSKTLFGTTFGAPVGIASLTIS